MRAFAFLQLLNQLSDISSAILEVRSSCDFGRPPEMRRVAVRRGLDSTGSSGFAAVCFVARHLVVLVHSTTNALINNYIELY